MKVLSKIGWEINKLQPFECRCLMQYCVLCRVRIATHCHVTVMSLLSSSLFCCTQSLKHDFPHYYSKESGINHFMENVLRHYHLHIMLSTALKEALLLRNIKISDILYTEQMNRCYNPWHNSHMTIYGNSESTWYVILHHIPTFKWL